MRLLNIEIKNFRGIKHASIKFPENSRVICLIGPGDSGKSTLLSAIEWSLWPTWNLNVTDTDFYNCDISNPIEIIASITELPYKLITEDKYGLYLRRSDFNSSDNDEPIDNQQTVLTIRLTVNDDLEPKWEVITNRTEPKTIGHKDRRLISLGVVGFDHEKDFQWGRNSVLQKYINSHDILHNVFTQATRTAFKNTNLNELNKIESALTEIGNTYGVNFNGEIHNRILMQNGAYSTAIGLFDDKVPFAQRGLGSKRLLSIGMNVKAYENGTLVLIDEIETGLEPYRIFALINKFRTQFENSGQLIMTTHSVSAVCECKVDEIALCSNNDGELSIHYFGTNKEMRDTMQSTLRSSPDAFLCKRVIVCEGKTEVGILRALDKYRAKMGEPRFAHYGVGIILGGGGNKFFTLAKFLKDCGYNCCILMDSDIETEEIQKTKARNNGISVFDWEQGYAIEEQIFKDVSLQCANQLLSHAIEIKGLQNVKDHLDEEFKDEEKEYIVKDDSIVLCCNDKGDVSSDFLRRVGKVAKGKFNKRKNKTEGAWFKRIDIGEEIGDIIFSSKEYIRSESYFENIINAILNWVTGNEN